jgi:hypothetical protein
MVDGILYDAAPRKVEGGLMIQVVTSKEWNEKVVRALGFIVEAYETCRQEIFYRVNVKTYPTDCIRDKEYHPTIYIVNGLTDLRKALDIKNALKNIDDEYFPTDDPIVTISVTVSGNSFEIIKTPIITPDSISFDPLPDLPG